MWRKSLLFGRIMVLLKSSFITNIHTQRYSDGTVVHFPNLDMLPCTQRNGQIVVLKYRAEPTPTRTPRLFFTSLLSEGPNEARLCRESNLDLPIHSPARYLYVLNKLIGFVFNRLTSWYVRSFNTWKIIEVLVCSGKKRISSRRTSARDHPISLSVLFLFATLGSQSFDQFYKLTYNNTMDN